MPPAPTPREQGLEVQRGKLLVFFPSDEYHALVLRCEGGSFVELERETQGAFLDDWSVSSPPERPFGLWVWEGDVWWDNGSYFDQETDIHFEGSWRAATADELDVLLVQTTSPRQVRTPVEMYELPSGEVTSDSVDAAEQWAAEAAKMASERDEARANLAEASRMWDGPETTYWLEGVRKEAAHQVARWGKDHDDGKDPSDFFWTLGYLGGKALQAELAGDLDKAKHHTISSAALLLNWHARIAKEAKQFRPGIEDPDGEP